MRAALSSLNILSSAPAARRRRVRRRQDEQGNSQGNDPPVSRGCVLPSAAHRHLPRIGSFGEIVAVTANMGRRFSEIAQPRLMPLTGGRGMTGPVQWEIVR